MPRKAARTQPNPHAPARNHGTRARMRTGTRATARTHEPARTRRHARVRAGARGATGEAGSASGRRVSRMSAPNLGAHRTPTPAHPGLPPARTTPEASHESARNPHGLARGLTPVLSTLSTSDSPESAQRGTAPSELRSRCTTARDSRCTRSGRGLDSATPARAQGNSREARIPAFAASVSLRSRSS